MLQRIRHLTTAGKMIASAGFMGLMGVLSTVTWVGLNAAAASKTSVPTPTITATPSTRTSSTAAAFSYTDSQSVTFVCTLDSGAARACGTGTSGSTSYTGLAAGAHTFEVEAQIGSSTSAAAKFTWTVDLAPPALVVTSPAAGTVVGAAKWSSGCSVGNICGTAADAAGVKSVAVALRQDATGKYWNGSNFAGPLKWTPATGTANWSVVIAPPSDGPYTVLVQAADLLGNATPSASPASSAFTFDGTGPAAPSITDSPTNPTTATTAAFKYTAAEPGVAFRCSLDGAASTACSATGVTYKGLSLGDHRFDVTALDSVGNASAATRFAWTVLTNGFSVRGTPKGTFAPGVQVPVDITIGNPFTFPISVTDVGITVNSSDKAGCGPENLVVSKPFAGPITVPAGKTVSLSGLGLKPGDWPALQMPDLPVNQDACKGAQFNLSYTGSAVQ